MFRWSYLELSSVQFLEKQNTLPPAIESDAWASRNQDQQILERLQTFKVGRTESGDGYLQAVLVETMFQKGRARLRPIRLRPAGLFKSGPVDLGQFD